MSFKEIFSSYWNEPGPLAEQIHKFLKIRLNCKPTLLGKFLFYCHFFFLFFLWIIYQYFYQDSRWSLWTWRNSSKQGIDVHTKWLIEIGGETQDHQTRIWGKIFFVQCNLNLVALKLVKTCDLVTVLQRPFFKLLHKIIRFSDVM